jgi:hypothetical protein
MKRQGSKEVAWNVLEGATMPSVMPFYLVFTDHRYQYDTSKKAAALTYAAELIVAGFANVRIYRAETVRTFRGPIRIGSTIHVTLYAE